MILVRCKCGCHFTLDDDTFSKMNELKCINCLKYVELLKKEKFNDFSSAIENSDLQVYHLPDGTKIKFSFS